MFWCLLALLVTFSDAAWGIWKTFVTLNNGSDLWFPGNIYDSGAASLPKFNGQDYGLVNQTTSLKLSYTEVNTWQNGNDDVSSAKFRYRVYHSAATTIPNYQEDDIPYLSNNSSNDKLWQANYQLSVDLLTNSSAVQITFPGTYIIQAILFAYVGPNSQQDGPLQASFTLNCGPRTICPTFSTCQTNGSCVCESGYLMNGTRCQKILPITCSNNVKDGQETAVDCGGPSCSPCNNGKECETDADCLSNLCGTVVNSTMKRCAASIECMDGVKNGNETDVDCGGPVCGATCNEGARCGNTTDCVGGLICNIANTCQVSVTPSGGGSKSFLSPEVKAGMGVAFACVSAFIYFKCIRPKYGPIKDCESSDDD